MPEKYSADIEEVLGVLSSEGETASFSASVSGLPEPYEAASLMDNGMVMWRPGLNSADRDILGLSGRPKEVMDARVRDFTRNDPLVSGAESHYRDSIIGSHYRLALKPNWRYLGLDEVWAKEHKAEVENAFKLASDSPKCYFDASGRKTFTEMLRLAVGVKFMGGEVLQTVEWIRDNSRPFKTAIQFVETDRLKGPSASIGSNIRGGVERDPKTGKPIAYYILRAHPSDYIYDVNLESYTADRILATKPWGRKQVLHYFEQARVDQTRGIAAIIASLKPLRAADRLQNVTLEQAILAATYASSVESELPSEQVFAAMGANQGNAIRKWTMDYMGALNEYTGGRNLMIDGVKVPVFFPGTKLNVKAVGTPGTIGSSFEASLHRHTAANLGMSYEEYTKDFTNANYSSLKAGVALTKRHMNAEKKILADRMANDILWLWYEEMFNNRQFTTLPKNAPSFYEKLNAEAYLSADWISSGWGQIDELKETQAAFLRIQYGLSTREDECARFGKDVGEVMAQQAIEQAEAKRLGLEYGSSQTENSLAPTPSTPSEPSIDTDEDKEIKK